MPSHTLKGTKLNYDEEEQINQFPIPVESTADKDNWTLVIKAEDVAKCISEALADGVNTRNYETRQMVEKQIRELTQVAVSKIIDESAKSLIETAVAEMMEEGWQPTDLYGQPTGMKITLKARLSQIIENSDRRSYNNDKVNLKEMVKNHVEHALKDVSVEVKAIVKDMLKDKVQSAVLSAFVPGC